MATKNDIDNDPHDEAWAIWAFGDEVWLSFKFAELDTIDLMEAWNRRHSDLMLVNPDDSIINGIKRMKAFYNKHKG